MQEYKKYFSGLSRNTFLLALSSLFSDISTEMLYPILPIFMTQVLQANGSIIGIIEGIATATQNIIQGFSGFLSDKFQKRKPIALFGYTLSAISKPLIGFAGSWQEVLGSRFLDRLGAGTRSAPRDALIAASADEKDRGKAFGLEGIGDNLGAFLGPLIAIILLYALHIDIRSIFFYAIIPGLLAVAMVLFVKESKVIKSKRGKIDVNIADFPKNYWKYLLVTAIFCLGNSSNAFLILQTRDAGTPLIFTIFIYAIYNLTAAVSSYPSGTFSDKFGRKKVLLCAFATYALVYIGFSLTTYIAIFGLLFMLYGVFQGIFRTVGKAYASDFVPQHLRASSIGWYSTVVGFSSLAASIIAGYLWDNVGHQSVFLFGTIFAVIGSLSLVMLLPKKNYHLSN